MADRPRSLVGGYYDAIDAGDYERLAGLLAPGFRQVREDMTLDGRDAFVDHMRDGRTHADTTHVIDGVFVDDVGERAVVQGRLRHADGSVSFGFVDVFAVEAAGLGGLVTYTNRRVE